MKRGWVQIVIARFRIRPSELTSESMNPLGYFGRTPWTGDRPIAKSLLTQDIHSCPEQDSNPWFQCWSSQRPWSVSDCAATGIG